MKLVYCLNRNISHLSYLINIVNIYPGRFLFLDSHLHNEIYRYYQRRFRGKEGKECKILTNLAALKKYNPDALLWTDFHYLSGNWLNVFIGHGDLISQRPDTTCYTYINREKLMRYDIILVAGQVQLDKYIRLSPKSKCYVVGSPRYDQFQKYRFFNNHRKTIVYTPTWRYSCVETFYPYLTRLLVSYNIIIAFHSLFLKIASNKKVFLTITKINNPHLKILYRKNFEDNLSKKNSVYLEEEGDLLSLVNSGDIQISDSMSSAMVDGFFLQKPVIIFDRDTTYSDLSQQLLKKLKNQELNKTITVLGVEYRHNQVFKYKDGLSSKRALSTINNVIDNR
jgi:hypothetical protein